MQDEASIKRQLHRERSFIPPYCPNKECEHHLGAEGFWQKDGTKKLKRFPYFSQRFRCKDCDSSFPYSFFFLEYRAKVWGHNETIFEAHRTSTSIRETARKIGHTERMVRGRKKKMARWGILRHMKFIEELKIEEPIVYDGLENFSHSQYDPNNINQAMGKNSFFVYDFNFCPLNRKGTMTPPQQLKKKKLENLFGKYPSNAIRTSTERVFLRLLRRAKGELVLHTDEHFQYRRVVEEDLAGTPILHLKTSSKITRNYQNPLFPVNYLDLQIRQESAAFRRETIAFSKHSIAMMDAYVLYVLYRNYMRPKFFNDSGPPMASPASIVGVCSETLSFKDFFSERVLPSQVEMDDDMKAYYHRIDPLSRRKIKSAA